MKKDLFLEKMKKKSKFTLIELIVVIVVLGILAAIVIPNVSSFQTEATKTAVESNVRNIQTSVDIYALENQGKLPTEKLATPTSPQPIDLDELHPEMLRNSPKTKGIYYWVHHNGLVYHSNVDSPVVSKDGSTLKWEPSEEAFEYAVYEVNGVNSTSSVSNASYKLVFKGKKEDFTQLNGQLTYNIDSVKVYVVSAISEEGWESAPVGENYRGYFTDSVDTAVAQYFADKGTYPTKVQPSVVSPEQVDFELLKGQYLKSIPHDIETYSYWVDFQGKVYRSTTLGASNNNNEWDGDFTPYNPY